MTKTEQVCDDCFSFKMFSEKCWFYWNGKKSCSQHRATQMEEPRFRTIDVPLSWLR